MAVKEEDAIFHMACEIAAETGCCVFNVYNLIDAFGLDKPKVTYLANEYQKRRRVMSIQEFVREHKEG